MLSYFAVWLPCPALEALRLFGLVGGPLVLRFSHHLATGGTTPGPGSCAPLVPPPCLAFWASTIEGPGRGRVFHGLCWVTDHNNFHLAEMALVWLSLLGQFFWDGCIYFDL